MSVKPFNAPWHQGPHYKYDIESPSGHVGSTMNHEQGIANAAHIVRCVNAHEQLVEALTFLLNETEDYIRINNLSAHHNHSLEMARAALAAAKVEDDR